MNNDREKVSATVSAIDNAETLWNVLKSCHARSKYEWFHSKTGDFKEIEQFKSHRLRHKRTKKSTPTFSWFFSYFRGTFPSTSTNSILLSRRNSKFKPLRRLFFALNGTSLSLFLYAVKSSEKSVAGEIRKNDPETNQKSDKTRTHFECYGLRFHIASAIIYYVFLYAELNAQI